MKKKNGKPIVLGAPIPRSPSIVVTQKDSLQVPTNDYRGAILRPHVRRSTANRSQWKGKQIWRPRPYEKMNVNKPPENVIPGQHSRGHAIVKIRQEWMPKKGIPADERGSSYHPGECSRAPQPDLVSEEETDFKLDHSIENLFTPHVQPKIRWRRRSEVYAFSEEEAEEEEEAMDVEVVYMVEHVGESSNPLL